MKSNVIFMKVLNVIPPPNSTIKSTNVQFQETF